jgi:hypothetical protein
MTRNYDFTVVLSPDTDLTEELADELFSAGCDDGSPGVWCGKPRIQFSRDGVSLEVAIRSAVANVKSAGCIISHVELDDEALASLLS